MVKASVCGTEDRRFESDYPPSNDPLAQLAEHLTFNQGVRSSNLRWVTIAVMRYNSLFFIGLSPSGKATDFDSVIPWVRIPPAQPKLAPRLNPRGYLYLFVFLIIKILLNKRKNDKIYSQDYLTRMLRKKTGYSKTFRKNKTYGRVKNYCKQQIRFTY